MANKIQIKHGSGVPGGGKLSSFELGYATQTGQLYISTTGSDILGITPASHNHAWSEVTGKPAQATRWPTWSEVTGGNTSVGDAGSAKKKYSWGGFYSAASNNTGVIRIYVGTSNTMFNAKISLRSYSYLADISVGGYTYTSTGNWHMPQATGRVHGGTLNVRFSGSGAHRYIQIGDTNTNWSGYLHVTIDDVSVGYTPDFTSPFAVSLETAYIGTTGSTQTVGEPYHSGNLPTTATRWPTWSEVTSKPSTFPPDSHTHAYVPTSRTVNGKALSANISLTAADVGASASGHTHSYVPTSRTVNSKALSANISLTAADVGAATTAHKHTATLLRSAIQVAANSSITFTDGANHGLYIVSVRWSTDLWIPVTVPADGLKYAHPWVNDLLPFRLSKSGTTLTLKREGSTAQYYMVHGVT